MSEFDQTKRVKHDGKPYLPQVTTDENKPITEEIQTTNTDSSMLLNYSDEIELDTDSDTDPNHH